MGKGSARPVVGLAAALGVALGLACDRNEEDDSDHEQFRADVLWCEDAVARLAECCPGGQPLACYHHRAGCGPTTTHNPNKDPQLSREETRCIRDLGCDALRERGVCDRTSSRARFASGIVDAGYPPLQVCP